MNICEGKIGCVFAIIIFIGIGSVSSAVNGNCEHLTKAALEEIKNSSTYENKSMVPKTIRVKRQETGGKYEEASKMPMLKIIRVFVQMFRNLWAEDTYGGTSPWHKSVPRPVVELFKARIRTTLVDEGSKEQQERSKE